MLRKWIGCDPSATWGKLIDAAADMIHYVPGTATVATEGMLLYVLVWFS